MWSNIGHKIDSLILRNKKLEEKQGRVPTLPRVRVMDGEGNIRDYGNLDEIKKRLLEKKKEN